MSTANENVKKRKVYDTDVENNVIPAQPNFLQLLPFDEQFNIARQLIDSGNFLALNRFLCDLPQFNIHMYKSILIAAANKVGDKTIKNTLHMFCKCHVCRQQMMPVATISSKRKEVQEVGEKEKGGKEDDKKRKTMAKEEAITTEKVESTSLLLQNNHLIDTTALKKRIRSLGATFTKPNFDLALFQ